MTKRDYIMFAAVLKKLSEDDDKVRDVIMPLAKMLKEENPNFNYLKFLEACNVKLEDV